MCPAHTHNVRIFLFHVFSIIVAFFIYFLNLTPEPWPDGELFEQSSELDEDVDVGVMETELFPEIH